MSKLGKQDIELFKQLQQDLPLSSRPFAEIGLRIGLSEEEVINKINQFRESGIIRRFGSALRHRELGFSANAMVVWNVADELTEEIGRQMATFPEVTHCYQRPRFPGWPYNLFTMVHGQSEEECRRVAASMAQKINIDQYDLLFSSKELKKTSMTYFVD